MAKQSRLSLFRVVLGQLGWPLFFGGAACVGFYVLIRQGVITSPWVIRYFDNHPVQFVETAMFFVALSALILKLVDVVRQQAIVGRDMLEPHTTGGAKAEDADRLLQSLEANPKPAQQSYLGRRLRNALRFVGRNGSADGLDDELKYLSEADHQQRAESYSLVKIVIWATPMLGFLGTVIGISAALGNLSPDVLVGASAASQELTAKAENASGAERERLLQAAAAEREQSQVARKQAMNGLRGGLNVAFDTTTLALTLSIILMFAQFMVDRMESQLLAAVDAQTRRHLENRFEQTGGDRDPQLAFMRRMAETVLQSSEDLVQRQAEIWQASMEAAGERWTGLVGDAGRQLQQSLITTLNDALESHADRIAAVGDRFDRQSSQTWSGLAKAIEANVQVVGAQNAKLVKHGELLRDLLEATGDVRRLEAALNDNLGALAGSKNFEDTVMSLAAAIHLLNTRLNGPVAATEDTTAKGRAA